MLVLVGMMTVLGTDAGTRDTITMIVIITGTYTMDTNTMAKSIENVVKVN